MGDAEAWAARAGLRPAPTMAEARVTWRFSENIRGQDFQSPAISTFPRFPQQKFFLVGLTACGSRVTRAVRERSDRPSLGKHGKRKLDDLHGARKDRTASAKFGATRRHGEALGLDQRWAGRSTVRQLMEGATQTTDLT